MSDWRYRLGEGTDWLMDTFVIPMLGITACLMAFAVTGSVLWIVWKILLELLG